MNIPDIWGVNRKKAVMDKKPKKKKGKWEVAGTCEDSEYEYDMLMNAKSDLEEAGFETKIEGTNFGYVLYVRE